VNELTRPASEGIATAEDALQELELESEMSFRELAWARYIYQREIASGKPAGPHSAAYQRRLRWFTEAHGPLFAEVWSTNSVAGIVVTRRRVSRWGGALEDRDVLALHRDTALLTQPLPELEAALYEGDDLALRAQGLGISSATAVINAVLSAATVIIGFLDNARASPTEGGAKQAVVDNYRARIASAEDLYVRRASREAQIAYLSGTVRGVFIWSAVALLLGFAVWTLGFLDLHSAKPIALATGCAAAGAMGSLASVIWRVSGSTFRVDYELGRKTIIWLASFRPLLGALFAVALYFALRSGILNIERIAVGGELTYLYLFVAFLGGFSERLAPDVFKASERGLTNSVEDTRAPESVRTTTRNRRQTGEPD
jgi:hypothetical protein